eukprot:gene5254-2973_t
MALQAPAPFITHEADDLELATLREHGAANNWCTTSIAPLRDAAARLAERARATPLSANACDAEASGLASRMMACIQDADIRAYIASLEWHAVLSIFAQQAAPDTRRFKAGDIIEAVADAALRVLAASTTPPSRRDRRRLPIAADRALSYDRSWAPPLPAADAACDEWARPAPAARQLPAAQLVPRPLQLPQAHQCATAAQMLEWLLCPGDEARHRAVLDDSGSVLQHPPEEKQEVPLDADEADIARQAGGGGAAAADDTEQLTADALEMLSDLLKPMAADNDSD